MALPENTSPYFAEIIETLLAGQAICEYRHPKLHHALHDRERDDRAAADTWLAAIGRRIELTNDVFYAVHEGFGETVDARAGRVFDRYLREANRNMLFFDILRLAQGGKVIETGDTFVFGDVLARINQDKALTDQLLRLATESSKMKDPNPEAALRKLLDMMEAYLYEVDASAQQYVVTGEYELFNAWFAFVFEKEGIDITELEGDEESSVEAARQGSLL